MPLVGSVDQRCHEAEQQEKDHDADADDGESMPPERRNGRPERRLEFELTFARSGRDRQRAGSEGHFGRRLVAFVSAA
jgi:hypothetical protein